MGMDTVEMVMEMEDTFGVELTEADVEAVRTPRDLVDVIFGKLRHSDVQVCQTQRGFYLLRRAFMQELGLARNDIRLDSHFREWIPPEHERELWPRLQVSVSARGWPDLARPLWMVRLLTCIVLAVMIIICLAITTFLATAPVAGFIISIMPALILTIPLAIVAAWSTERYRHYIPGRYQTIRDLVRCTLSSDHIAWKRKEVSSTVKLIVMEQLDVKEADYREDARFIEDFGAD